MKTLIVVGHPELADSQTQAFLKAAAGDRGRRHVLTAPFDPASERQLLWQADRIILQFPLYWYNVPAILKQWLDQVFDDHLLGPAGDRLAGKELGAVVSLGRPLAEFGAGKRQGFSLDDYLRPLQGLARATRMRWLPPLAISQFAYQGPRDQAALLVAYQQYLTLPQPASFADRVNWFAAQLARQAERAQGDQATRYAQLRALLMQRQAELSDLQDNLRLIKEGGQ